MNDMINDELNHEIMSRESIIHCLFQALELIRSGLNDSWVSPSHKLALSQRATRICQSAKLKDKFESFLVDLPLLNPAEPRNNTIVGRSLPRLIIHRLPNGSTEL